MNAQETTTDTEYTVTGPRLHFRITFDQTRNPITLDARAEWSGAGPHVIRIHDPKRLERLEQALWEDALLDLSSACRVLVEGDGQVLPFCKAGPETASERVLRYARRVILPLFKSDIPGPLLPR